jgi:predicted GIY-YIG superfamily endonuclease
MPYTYMVRCSDDSYYVGSTWDLERRIWEHNEGVGAAYTRRRRPVTLVWAVEFDRIDDAFVFEKQVQNWSRAKREALIANDYAALPALAKKDFSKRRAAEAEKAEE